MPIMQPKPTATPVKEPLQVQVAEPRYQSSTPIVDTRYTPSANILQHVEGSSWTVNYYSQMLGTESELSPQQLDQASVYQQYCLIQEMELKVTSPLTPTQDPATKTFDVVGAATTHSRFIPNKGDMFLADIGDGRMGVFTVVQAEKKTYHKDALYSIEFKLVNYADEARLEDLEHKTVKRTVFRKDFLQFGQNPQVLSDDFDYLIKFEDSYRDLLSHYLHDFFSREYQTLMIPDQLTPSYDPFLAKSLMDWIGTHDHAYISRIKLPRVLGDQAMDQTTIWDCLARMDEDLLPMAMYRSRLLNTVYFRNQPHMSGIFFSGIKNVVYPKDNRTDVDADHEVLVTEQGQALTPGDRRYTDLQRLMDADVDGFGYQPTEGGLPDVVPVTVDDYYVFSEAFYRTDAIMSSNLEKLVQDGLAQRALDKPTLLRLATNARRWGNLERFYYIPALLALLKVAIRTN